MAKESASSNKNVYKATDVYKLCMPNKGLLSEAQHAKLIKGDPVDLKGANEKQMRYLLINNLIIKG